MDFRVLKYDPKGQFIGAVDGVITESVPGGVHRYRTLIGDSLDPSGQNLVVLTRVKTNSGVWFVKPEALDAFSKRGNTERTDLQVGAIYEPNVVLTPRDKGEILHIAVDNIARQPGTSELVSNRGQIVLLRDLCDFPFPLKDAMVNVQSLDEIQAIADKEQRVVFTRGLRFEVEGSLVKVYMVFSDRLARGPERISIPFTFHYQFVLTKHDKEWVLRESRGYS